SNTSESIGGSSGFSHGAGGHNKNVQWGDNNSTSTTRTKAWSKVAMRLCSPQNAMAMPSGVSYVFLNGLKYVILATRQPYWTLPHLKDCVDPDPFHPRGA